MFHDTAHGWVYTISVVSKTCINTGDYPTTTDVSFWHDNLQEPRFQSSQFQQHSNTIPKATIAELFAAALARAKLLPPFRPPLAEEDPTQPWPLPHRPALDLRKSASYPHFRRHARRESRRELPLEDDQIACA
jgi:hypothetical protein